MFRLDVLVLLLVAMNKRQPCVCKQSCMAMAMVVVVASVVVLVMVVYGGGCSEVQHLLSPAHDQKSGGAIVCGLRNKANRDVTSFCVCHIL